MLLHWEETYASSLEMLHFTEIIILGKKDLHKKVRNGLSVLFDLLQGMFTGRLFSGYQESFSVISQI